MIAQVREVESRRGYQRHPIGMTFQYPDASRNANLFDGPADWVSPGFTHAVADDPWYLDPPPNDGRKVVISGNTYVALLPGNESNSMALKLDAGIYTLRWLAVDGSRLGGDSELLVARPSRVTLPSPEGAAPAIAWLARRPDERINHHHQTRRSDR